MDLTKATEKLNDAVGAIVAEARARYPGIHAGYGLASTPIGPVLFRFGASFMFDVQDEQEDLLFFLRCAENDSDHMAPGGRTFFPEVEGEGRYTLRSESRAGTVRSWLRSTRSFFRPITTPPSMCAWSTTTSSRR